MTHKRFPPWVGHVLIPASSRREALAGLSLYTPSHRRGLALRFTTEWMVRLLGPAALPGRRAEMAPLAVAGEWDRIEELLRQDVGPFDALAVHTRRKPHRPGGAVLLLLNGDPVAFLKVGLDFSIEHEHRVLTRLETAPRPTAFAVPRPLGFHTVGETRVSLMTVLLRGSHHPVTRPLLPAVIADVKSALRHLPRPKDVPSHWMPMHGDLSPWNLRMDSTGRVVLFDWEEAGFGPPGADEVYFAVTAAAVGRRRYAVAGAGAEAVQYWRARLEERPPSRLYEVLFRELSRLDLG